MANQASFCHVFLSFKGETRNKFTCFLYEALKAEGFIAFMDKSAIRVGDEVHSTIQDGIKSSMSAIIVFSQNYAYSTWCLDELVLILERLKNSRYFIIPIFYEVEHRDIKHQLGNYGLALEKHRARHSDKVEKWRQALAQAGNILGDHVEGLQSIFIQKTVKLFREKLAAMFPECCLPVPKELVNPSSSQQPPKDNVILYTTSTNNGLGANDLVKKVLKSGDVMYEKRNCIKEPKYMKEIEELVGKDNVRFPMVIVNGKDLCGEEVEVLDDFVKQKLIQVLRTLYTSKTSVESLQNMTSTISLNDTSTPTGYVEKILSRIGVHVTNKLSNTLVAHCRSKDDDFYDQQLNKDQSMEWHFYRNPFGRSLYWCQFQNGNRRKHVELYDESKYGILPIYNPVYSKLFYWEVREDGFYLNHYPSPNPPTPWVKRHSW